MQTQPKIRSLTLVDENRTLGYQLQSEDVPAFKSLTTIELYSMGLEHEALDLIVQCLKAATGLKRLALSFERDNSVVPSLLVTTLSQSCDWPSLTYLEITDASFPQNHMVKFLEKCISLRDLVLRECSVSVDDIFALRTATIRQLTSIVITGGEQPFLESSLLNFVNKTSSSLISLDGESVRSIPRERTIHTKPYKDSSVLFKAI